MSLNSRIIGLLVLGSIASGAHAMNQVNLVGEKVMGLWRWVAGSPVVQQLQELPVAKKVNQVSGVVQDTLTPIVNARRITGAITAIRVNTFNSDMLQTLSNSERKQLKATIKMEIDALQNREDPLNFIRVEASTLASKAFAVGMGSTVGGLLCANTWRFWSKRFIIGVAGLAAGTASFLVWRGLARNDQQDALDKQQEALSKRLAGIVNDIKEDGSLEKDVVSTKEVVEQK